MGWLPLSISVLAAVLMYQKHHYIMMGLAIVVSVGCFWSWGIMHNYATESAKKRKGYKGGFFDITEKEAESAPDRITHINMACSLIGVVLFIAALFLK